MAAETKELELENLHQEMHEQLRIMELSRNLSDAIRLADRNPEDAEKDAREYNPTYYGRLRPEKIERAISYLTKLRKYV